MTASTNAREDEVEEVPHTAAELAARVSRLASEAADIAAREETHTRLTEVIARVASSVAHELQLAPIVDAVLDQTIHTLGARFAYVHLADESRRELHLIGSRSLGDDLTHLLGRISYGAPLLTARAAATRDVQLVSALEQLDPGLATARELMSRLACQSMVALPLVARAELVGVLAFGLADPHDFDAEEQAAFRTCAEIFAFGIRNAAMYEEERRLHALFEAVGNAAASIVGELKLRSILQNIVDQARAVADAEYCALGIAVSPDRSFEPWVFSGMSRELEQRIGPHPRPVGALGAVAWSGRTIRIPDVTKHPEFVGFPEHHPSMTTFLGVPVLFQGKSVGNLYLTNKRGAAEFSEDDQHAVELLASHAAAAVHQASLRQQLEDERARFTAIVENAPYGVVFVEAGTEKLISNQRAIDLVGQSDVVTVGDYHGEVCTPEGRPLPVDEWPARRVLSGERFETQEMLVRTPRGREVPLLLSAAPIMSGSGTLEGVVVVFEDISTLKDLQRLREEWVSVVTHDLRQPLNTIVLSVSLLERVAESPDPQRLYRAVQQLQKASRTLERMIGDLSDVSRIESKHLAVDRRRLEVEELVREVAGRQQPLARDHVLAVRTTGHIPSVCADPIRIDQVITNLLTNAVKYSDPGTPIDIELATQDGMVSVAVTNRGAGIPQNELPKIFDRYYRTREGARRAGGLGLGLYIAKGLVDAHGGRIWAQSSPGETTTFAFTLPAFPAE